MESHIENTEPTLEGIRKDIAEIKKVLIGDPYLQNGFIAETNKRLDEHCKRLIALENIVINVKTNTGNIFWKIIDKAISTVAIAGLIAIGFKNVHF